MDCGFGSIGGGSRCWTSESAHWMGGVKLRDGLRFGSVNWAAWKPLSFRVGAFVVWDLGWLPLSVWVGGGVSPHVYRIYLSALNGYRPGFYSMN